MGKVLNDLYFGGIAPCEDQAGGSSEMRQAKRNAEHFEDQLRERFSQEQQETFEKLLRTHREVQNMVAQENYIQGFRMGVRLIMECMDQEE